MQTKVEDVRDVLELALQGKIKESVLTLESISTTISQDDFVFLLESSFLKHLFDHFTINTKQYHTNNNKLSSTSLVSEHITLCFKAMGIVRHVLESPMKQAPRVLIKSNVKDFMCLLAVNPQTSEHAFELLSESALFIPEIFQKQMILTLQRCLIEKCAQPANRLEHFLRIFYNLREHSEVYPIDAYFYVNFLRLQYSASQKQRMTRTSILLILKTLEHVINADKLEESTISNVFSFLTDCFYPRICMEYHIMSPIDSVHKSDSRIQLETLKMLHAFMQHDQVPLAAFIAKQVDGLKNMLTYKKREEAILIVLELFINAASTSVESIAIEFISTLLNWEKFQKVLEALTSLYYKKMQANNKRITEAVCDLLLEMLKQEKEFIYDFFLNEFLIGELADMSSILDRKRRVKGVEMIIKVLNYIDRQPMEKFIFEDDEMIDMRYSEAEIEDALANKIIMSSVIDVFEVASFPQQGKLAATPSLIHRMQLLSLKIKTKFQKVFGVKFPDTLESVAAIPFEPKTNSTNDDEWEDVDENDTNSHQQATSNSDFNQLKNLVQQFFK